MNAAVVLCNTLWETGQYILKYIGIKTINTNFVYTHIYIPALLTEIKLDIVENVKKYKTGVVAIRDLQDKF